MSDLKFMVPVDGTMDDRRKGRSGLVTLDWREQGIMDELRDKRFAQSAFMDLVIELHALRDAQVGASA